IQNCEYLVDHRRIAKAADLEVGDWRVRHLGSQYLVHLDKRPFHGELERLRRVQPPHLNAYLRSGCAADERRNIADRLAGDVLTIDRGDAVTALQAAACRGTVPKDLRD